MPPPPSSEPNNPHDALFRKTFSDVKHAAAELRAVLPPALLTQMNLASLRLCAGTFVDAELASSQSDLLFAAEVHGKPAFIHLLFEHQSRVDELMAFRTLRYVVRILDRHVATSGGGRKSLPLPLVLPIVLHHSVSGWTASTRVEELFDPNLVALPGVARHVPRLDFLLDDISRISDDALARRALGALPTLTLWALRDARHVGRIERGLPRWQALMQALYETENGREALLTIFRYLSLVAEDLSPQTLLASLAPRLSEAKDTLMTTLAERWIAEGRVEGEAKGRVEGEAKGRVEGEAKGRVEGVRAMLIQLMSAKFGELSREQRERVEAASEEEMLFWSKRVLRESSLAAVFQVQ
jgi:predicted transposase/invertase (TIGR01784 family)